MQNGQRVLATVNRYDLRSNDKGQNDSIEQHRRSHNSESVLVRHYCRHRGHVMSECWTFEKKEKNKHKTTLVVKKAWSAESASYPLNRLVVIES